MRGRLVSDSREAVVALRLLGGSDRSTGVEAVIDTGFTGHLTLPPEVVRSLDLTWRGFVEVELADGGAAALGVYGARVLWYGRRLAVPVYEAEGDPLVGMSLLRGSRLTVEVVPEGGVVIEDLSQEPDDAGA